MRDKDKTILQKIINYINDIEYIARGIDEVDFTQDVKTLYACAFIVMQIGELAREASDELKTASNEIPWTSITGMRNRIVHEYEKTDYTILWKTIRLSLPELKDQLLALLSRMEDQ